MAVQTTFSQKAARCSKRISSGRGERSRVLFVIAVVCYFPLQLLTCASFPFLLHKPSRNYLPRPKERRVQRAFKIALLLS